VTSLFVYGMTGPDEQQVLWVHPGLRLLEVKVGCAGQRAELIANVGAVEARDLLDQELSRLAARAR
jgi:hypothetical protein